MASTIDTSFLTTIRKLQKSPMNPKIGVQEMIDSYAYLRMVIDEDEHCARWFSPVYDLCYEMLRRLAKADRFDDAVKFAEVHLAPEFAVDYYETAVMRNDAVGIKLWSTIAPECSAV